MSGDFGVLILGVAAFALGIVSCSVSYRLLGADPEYPGFWGFACDPGAAPAYGMLGFPSLTALWGILLAKAFGYI